VIDEQFGARVRQHQAELGLGDTEYGKAIADEMKKYGGTSVTPISRSALLRWRKGQPPSPLHAILLSDLMGIPTTQLGTIAGRDLNDERRRRIIRRNGGDPDRGEIRSETRMARAVLPADVPPALGVDWERIAEIMRSMRRTDARAVADEWRLTRHYISILPKMSARTLLDLMSQHITRLCHMRQLARDEDYRRELDVMTCQTAVCAGILWTGLTDYGLAMESYRFAADLARELNDRSLLSTALIMQAQLYGGHLEPRLALSPLRISHLITEAEACADAEASPQARMFLYSHVSSLHTLVGNTPAARRAIELAQDADVRIERNAELYFAATTPHYCTVHEGAVELALRNPGRAIELYTHIIEHSDESLPGTLAWFKWSLATACLSVREPRLAAKTTKDALRLARMVDAPFLVRGIEATAETLMAGYDRESEVRDLRDYLHHDGEGDE
jgi:hypothetical protein